MTEILLNILVAFWGALGQMAPYLLFGFLAAGALSVLITPRTVERHLGGRGIGPVLKAAAFGIPLPLCSCGVIPVAASLRRHGASRGATTAFLISTPQDGVDSIAVTLSLLGPTFALFRPLVALIGGVAGGVAAGALGDGSPAASSGRAHGAQCTDPCCAPGGGGKLRRALAYGFDVLPRDIGKALLLGLAAAALITALVPADALAPLLGGGIGAMLIMMLFGIPLYVCATASVPVAAAMIAKGVSPGAALVFLMTGPATNAATIATVWKVMGRRTAIVYLVSVAGTALAAGLALDHIFTVTGTYTKGEPPWMLPEAVESACAVALLAVLGVAVVRSCVRRPPADPAPTPAAEGAEPTPAELRITGMTCDHCRQAVQRALLECDGAATVEVDLARGRAVVTGSADVAELASAVESLGYGVEVAGDP